MGNAEAVVPLASPAPDAEVGLSPQELQPQDVYEHEVNGVVERAYSVKEVIDRCPVLGRLALTSPALAMTLAAGTRKEISPIGPERTQKANTKDTTTHHSEQPLVKRTESQAKQKPSQTSEVARMVLSEASETASDAVSAESAGYGHAKPEAMATGAGLHATAAAEQSPALPVNDVIANGQSHSEYVRTPQYPNIAPEEYAPIMHKHKASEHSAPLPDLQLPPVVANYVIPLEHAQTNVGSEVKNIADSLSQIQQAPQEQPLPDADLASARQEIVLLYSGSEGAEGELAAEKLLAIGAEAGRVMDAAATPDMALEIAPEETYAAEIVELHQQLVALHEAQMTEEPGAGLTLLQETERLLELDETELAPAEQAEPVELSPDSVIRLRKIAIVAEHEVEADADKGGTAPVTASLETAGRMQDKPLEVAFAHVARFLKVEAAGDNMGTNLQEHPAAQELIEAVANLKNAYAEHADEPQLADRLSPRLVNELVKLMGLLGYEQPQEVLAAFAEQHGVQSLLEMIEYLCQLSHHENRKEFAPASTLGRFTDAGQTDNDDTHRLRVMAQGLFRLLSDLFALPAGFFDADLMPS